MSNDIQTKTSTILNLKIAIKASVITSSFIIMINFFDQTADYTDIGASIPTIATIVIAWLVVVVLIIKSITSSLIDKNLSDTAFLFFYILTIAPTTQIAFQVFKKLNNNLVDILPFLGIVLLINFILVPVVLIIINTTKLTKKRQKTAILGAIIYCAVATFFINFISQP